MVTATTQSFDVTGTAEEVLNRLYKQLPNKPYVGNQNKVFNKITNKDTAVRYSEYIQLPTNKRHYIAFDLDYEGAGEIAAYNTPPTITIINLENYHAQALYELQEPVLMPLKNNCADWIRAKPINYYKAVKTAGTAKLNADAGFNGTNIKNPFNPKWQVFTWDITYTLDELADVFKLQPEIKYDPKAHLIYGGRNDELFHESRFWAYRYVVSYSSFNAFFDAVFKFCIQYNNDNFVDSDKGQLGAGEIKSVAKSVSKYTWANRNTSWIKKYQKNIGTMGFNPIDRTLDKTVYHITKQSRQRAGAHHTNDIQKQNNERKIELAIKYIQDNNLPLKISEIAKQTGLTRQTINKYKYLFEKPVNPREALFCPQSPLYDGNP